MGMALATAIENITKLRVQTGESTPERQSDFLFKWKDRKSKITSEVIRNQNQQELSYRKQIARQLHKH